nr:MAG TPA: hypothetical protein [Caudoviricetes sp.]
MLISIAYLILFICFQLVSPLSNMYLWFRVTYRDTGSASTYSVTASSLSQGIEQRRSCYLRRSISLNGEDFPVKVLTIPFSPRNVLKNHGVLIQVFAFKIRLFDFVRRDIVNLSDTSAHLIMRRIVRIEILRLGNFSLHYFNQHILHSIFSL